MDYATKTSRIIRWGKLEYFNAIKKLVTIYNIKLDYDIELLMNKSHAELKFMYTELRIQLFGVARNKHTRKTQFHRVVRGIKRV